MGEAETRWREQVDEKTWQEQNTEWFDYRKTASSGTTEGWHPSEKLKQALWEKVEWPTNKLTVGDLRKQVPYKHLNNGVSLMAPGANPVVAEMHLAEWLAEQFAGQTVDDPLSKTPVKDCINALKDDLAGLYEKFGFSLSSATAKERVEQTSRKIVAAISEITGLKSRDQSLGV